ncbi:putative aminopeptidase W07G4.4 isoform X1 [Octopus sinensis]|uniref:Aminopeptidase W07G4.4 isoform X1 n=1 Tax=Octopus sinensis TaxID=2607531 RepID=A0A6P7U7W9_9MOLL|nr:putative aminopeptidase W07G4.4 isoform X1 [Octopus sinensis]
MASTRLTPELLATSDVADSRFDCVVLVTNCIKNLDGNPGFSSLKETLTEYSQVGDLKELTVLHCSALPSKRLIWSPTGPINRDYDDVRRWSDAAEKGIKKSTALKCKKPLLVPVVKGSFEQSHRVTILGALQGLYVPIEIREDVPERAVKAEKLGVWFSDASVADKELLVCTALEEGRVVTRDIGGSDPERMAAPKVAEYVKKVLGGSNSDIKITVQSNVGELEKSYPLLGAVNRATRNLERHAARVLLLEYTGSGSTEENVYLVGKGITYDTGGHDIKAGGHMAGMHRDKCGAAAVAGFFKVLSILKPKGIKVTGSMSMVRNSVGPDGYVADEIVTSRSNVRVRVGNTDAEGRMVMADLLCYMKEQAKGVKNAHIFTIATLTGHAVLAMGPDYTAVMDNGPAKKKKMSQTLQDVGHSIGDLFEISNIRREDYSFHAGKSEYEDVLQCNNLPSSQTPRGHQTPAAFLILASGMDKHGIDSNTPIPYSHIDVAGSSGPFPGVPTGAPVLALSSHYVLPRI